MKIPQTPPSFIDYIKNGTRFSLILSELGKWASGDTQYLHWEKLRHLPAPEGFTHEDWWAGLKCGRITTFKNIPLYDKKNQHFKFGLPDSLLKLLHNIDCGLGSAFALPDSIQSPATRAQYITTTLAQEAITSSQLEGAVTTREVAREMLRSGRRPRDKSERMILNNYRTMEHIRELTRQAGPGNDLTPELVLNLHRRVTEDTLEKPDAAGRLRTDAENVRVENMEGVVFHAPPPAAQLPARLRAMCDFANARAPEFFIHPVIRAIILHFWLAYDHPFVDGNGRTARALFYWAMLRAKYELFEFISISEVLLRAPARYAMAFLHTETDDNDLTYFILHQADVIEKAVQNLHAYIAQKKHQLAGAAHSLRNVPDLNHRQQALIAHALREPHTHYLITAHQRSHNVTHQTARDDLFGLAQRGFLTKHKAGRAYVFLVVPDLAQKLELAAQAFLDTTPRIGGAEPAV